MLGIAPVSYPMPAELMCILTWALRLVVVNLHLAFPIA
jgi:hypothetical protein